MREPGTAWNYENYETLLAVYAMKRALGSDRAYLEFPATALLDSIGMRNTLVSADRFGDFMLSSQVYTNARDLARFGLLYLRTAGVERRAHDIGGVDRVRAHAGAVDGHARDGSTAGSSGWCRTTGTTCRGTPTPRPGNRGQYVIVVPSHNLVIVRRGLDFGRQGFDRWDLTREVLKAFN